MICIAGLISTGELIAAVNFIFLDDENEMLIWIFTCEFISFASASVACWAAGAYCWREKIDSRAKLIGTIFCSCSLFLFVPLWLLTLSLNLLVLTGILIGE